MRLHDIYLRQAGAAWSGAGGIRRVIPLTDSLAKFLVRSRIRWQTEIAAEPYGVNPETSEEFPGSTPIYANGSCGLDEAKMG